MKEMKIAIGFPSGGSPGLRRALQRLPGAVVRDGGGRDVTLTGPAGSTVALCVVGVGDLETGTDAVRVLPDRLPPDGAVPLVFGARLSRLMRQRLRDAGISYADGAGHLGIFAGGIYVVLDEPAPSLTREPAQQALGHVGVRAVQFMVDHPRKTWTTTALAEVSGVSVGQAHKVLRLLEEERLVRRSGTGKRASRQLVDPDPVIDWLAAHRLTVHPTEQHAMGYVPARDAGGVAAYLAQAAVEHRWAVSGVAAARLYGVPVTTRVPVTLVRMETPAGAEVAEAMREIGIEATDEGANVRIVRDTGSVGTADRRTIDGASVAPPSRTYLDMFREARGSDAAELFRPTVTELANG